MKIVMIGQKGIPAVHGGIERHVEELAVRLASRGHQITVYTRPHFTPAEMKTYRGVRLVSLPSVKTKHLDAISHTLLATLHAIRSRPDIIHYHGVGPSLLAFLPKLFRSQAKVVSTFHCLDRKHKKWGFVARQFLRHGEWASVAYPDRTIAVSKTIQKYVAGVFEKKIDYIPNGVAPSPQRARHRSPTLRRFGLKSGGYIISVSRLIPHKGIHHLITAYRQLSTEQRLVIVGDGFYTDEYVQYLHALAGDDPRIVFTGFQSGQDLRDLFMHATLYVLPSEAEGLPIALLEAASYGVGIVASDIPENREVIHADRLPIGQTFATGDVDDLTRVLRHALERPGIMRQMATRAKRVVAEQYNWQHVAADTEDLYRQLANRPRTVTVSSLGHDRERQVAVSAA